MHVDNPQSFQERILGLTRITGAFCTVFLIIVECYRQIIPIFMLQLLAHDSSSRTFTEASLPYSTHIPQLKLRF